MRVLVAGSSGFLGSHLGAELRGRGHEVTPLTRPYQQLDQKVENTDVVVNLSGSSTVGNPHSRRWARNLRRSRVSSTRTLAEAVAASDRKPAFLAGNAIAWYGDHGDEPVTEAADSRGDSFLTDVTREWQAAAQPAVDAGARVCVLRTVPVMDAASSPLKQLLLLFKAGLGGRIGSGRQYMPMISLRDWVGAAAFLVEHDEVSGPVNLSCAQTPTNAEFTAELARLLRRPSFATVPAIVLKQAAGKLAPELLGSVRAVPQVLLDAGFRFTDPEVESVLLAGIAGVRSGA